MSEKDNKQRGPYGRPASAGGKAPAERRYGKPAARPQGERSYGKPAPQGERRTGKPPFRSEGSQPRYGRPAAPAGGEPRKFAKPAPQGEQRYGRPAPRPQGNQPRYGRPAPRAEGEQPRFSRPVAPTSTEERRYGKPAPRPQGDRPFSKPTPPGERRFGRPAPGGQGEQSRFGRPAPRPEGEQNRFDRPAPRPQQDRPRFAKPAYGKPSFGKPSFNRPAGPAKPRQQAAPAPAALSSDARRSALQVLNRVLLDSGYASLSLDEHFQSVRLSHRDKRLTTQIVYLTLENLNRLDHALDQLLPDPERLEKRVRNVLRLSAAQILLLDRVPDSASVNEAVKLTRDMGLEDLTGLVNGVLRNLIRQAEKFAWPTPADGLRYYRIMHNQPEWFAAKVLEHYGPDAGDQILTYKDQSHRTIIRPNLTRVTAQGFEELLAKKTWQVEKGLMPQAWYVKGASDIGQDADFLDGKFSIQGEGSMVAAEAAAPKLGQQVLDTCAAPGGKAAYMAEKMQGTGRVQAWDVHAHRVDLIQALADRLRLYNIRPAMRDALVYREQLERTMDVVLIDAPCTGTGVMADKPDLKIRLSEQSLTELTATQAQMLSTCSRYVKSGGTLVYATCSLLPEENQQQVELFLKEYTDFELQPLPDTIPAPLRQQEGPLGLQLLPHRDGVEGFYVARMRRR